MYAYPDYHNYDLDPVTDVFGFDGAVISGWDALMSVLRNELNAGKQRICFELYPGVNEEDLVSRLERETGLTVFRSVDARLPQQVLAERFARYITNDRVFGVLYNGNLEDCFDPDVLRRLQAEIAACPGPCLVLGTGAALLMPESDSLWHWGLTRWEIQLRMRRGMGTWMAGTLDGQQLTDRKAHV